MRSEMAQPCCGSRARVRRISRSRVPCGRSIRGSGIVLPYGFYREHTPPLVEAQGEDCEPHAVLGSRGRTWLTMVFGLPMDRESRSLVDLVHVRSLKSVCTGVHVLL